MLTPWHWIAELQTGMALLCLKASARRSAAADAPNVHLDEMVSLNFQLILAVQPAERPVTWISSGFPAIGSQVSDT
jgi:hypothetical protein